MRAICRYSDSEDSGPGQARPDTATERGRKEKGGDGGRRLPAQCQIKIVHTKRDETDAVAVGHCKVAQSADQTSDTKRIDRYVYACHSKSASQSPVRDRRLPRAMRRLTPELFFNNAPHPATGQDGTWQEAKEKEAQPVCLICTSEGVAGILRRRRAACVPLSSYLAECQRRRTLLRFGPVGILRGTGVIPQQQQQSKHTTAGSTHAREQVSWAGRRTCQLRSSLQRHHIPRSSVDFGFPYPLIHPYIRAYARTHAHIPATAWVTARVCPHQGKRSQPAPPLGLRLSLPDSKPKQATCAPKVQSNVDSTPFLSPSRQCEEASCRLWNAEDNQSTYRIPLSPLLHSTGHAPCASSSAVDHPAEYLPRRPFRGS
jgi:hypothetical protein